MNLNGHYIYVLPANTKADHEKIEEIRRLELEVIDLANRIRLKFRHADFTSFEKDLILKLDELDIKTREFLRYA